METTHAAHTLGAFFPLCRKLNKNLGQEFQDILDFLQSCNYAWTEIFEVA